MQANGQRSVEVSRMASGPGDLVYHIVSSTSEHASFHVHERLQAFNIDLVLDQVGI